MISWIARHRIPLWGNVAAIIAALYMCVVHIIGVKQSTDGYSWHSIAYYVCGLLVTVIPIALSLTSNAIRDKISRLERENERLSGLQNSVENVFELWLSFILDFAKFGANWRASFYVFDQQGKDVFIIVARESKDGLLKKKGRRTIFYEQGVIHEAWKETQERFYYPCDKMCKSRTSYAAEMVSRWQMDYNDAMKLTMQSRCILGQVIQDESGKKIGVVIAETEEKIKKGNRIKIQESFTSAVAACNLGLAHACEIYKNSILCDEDPREDIG